MTKYEGWFEFDNGKPVASCCIPASRAVDNPEFYELETRDCELLWEFESHTDGLTGWIEAMVAWNLQCKHGPYRPPSTVEFTLDDYLKLEDVMLKLDAEDKESEADFIRDVLDIVWRGMSDDDYRELNARGVL